MNGPLSRLADDLISAGGYLNTFGPCSDGDLMVKASNAIHSARWTIAELADLVMLLRGVIQNAGLSDPDWDAQLLEGCRAAQEMAA